MARFEAAIPIAKIKLLESNPNKMSASDQDALNKAVVHAKKKGLTGGGVTLLQPILVRAVDDHYVVVDGAHRLYAASKAGDDVISGIVIECEADEARVLQIGMNRLRGSLDVGDVGAILRDLTSRHPVEDLILGGYGASEIAGLLKIARSADEGGDPDHMEDEMPPDDEGSSGEDTSETIWSFDLTFETKADRDEAKRALRKAAGGGKGADLAVGLLALIREE